MSRPETRHRNRIRKYEITLAYMAHKYPLTFFPKGGRIKPVKVGILDDLVADNPNISRNVLVKFLMHYTRRKAYHEAVVDCVFRVDLEGKAAGKVEPSQKDHAQTVVRGINDYWAKKNGKRVNVAA